MNFSIPIEPEKKEQKSVVWKNLRQWIVIEKFNNPFGFICLLAVGVFIAAAIALKGIVIGVLVIALLSGPLALYYITTNTEWSLISYMTFAFTIMLLLRLGVSFPLGTLMDGMLLIFYLNFFIQNKIKNEWERVQSPISKWILIWIIYNLLEVGNPSATSRLAWVYTVRTVAIVALSFYIYLFNIRTKAFLKKLLKIWLFYCLLAAWYCFKQEFFGFYKFEDDYLHSDPNIMLLLYLAGHWRKFSFLNDPVVYAYNMAVASVICIALLTGPVTKKQKYILVFLIFSYSFNMIFSGTRGAFPLIPVAIMLYAIMRFSKTVLVMAIIFAIFFVGLIFVPTSNQNILRFQTAFRPNKDASYIARKINQARIKPFIWSHPMGGGLGSTGDWGKKFSPGSYLSGFPPDSGYVRVTVESGPIGLAIFCIMMFTILKTGINNYYTIRDPELKSYCLAATMGILVLNVGNFPQEALVQYPSNTNFYLLIAVLCVSKRIDQEQNNEKHA